MIYRQHSFSDAVTSLRPEAAWECFGNVYSGLNWQDTKQTKPTEEEINAEITRLNAQWIADEYKRQRAYAYPDWGEQLDYIYHNGIDKWKTDIVDPVKQKYPKPE